VAEPRLDDFDYALPPEQIAQEPAPDRDGARLLVLERASGARRHTEVRALPSLLAPGDLLVRNTTRVLPARLRGVKPTGGRVSALLLGPARAPGHWRALLRGSARLRIGHKLRFAGPAGSCDAEVAEARGEGEWVLAFPAGADPYALGEMPLPPYIRREAPRAADRERYQTVFAREPGAVAAPTAGLHLSEALLAELARRGVECADLVLHTGPGTFRPLRERDLRAGRLHAEAYALPEATAAAVDAARRRGGRVVAVGTTSARVLETCAAPGGRVTPGRGETDLFLRPGSAFRVVDALLTNFHLPRSSLLLLVAAFAGREAVLDAYAEAVRASYRFYSYGDAMLIA
jgi:S-adenosylmethionine:tRNA ribosyltransferase-isomerase